jgi:adenine-specific DNA methylase
MRVIALAPAMILQRFDELMRLGPFRGGEDLLVGGVGAAVADVLHRRAVEHRGFLRDHRDLVAQAVLRHAADIHPSSVMRPASVS